MSSTSGLSQGWSLGFSSTRVGRLYVDLVRDNFYNGALALATQASFNDGLWHTAALVVNRSSRQIRIFVDGSAQSLAYISTNPNYGAVSGSTFTLEPAYSQLVQMSPGYSTSAAGTSTVGNRFGLAYNGWLDEARFYNRVLTDAEVQALSAQVLATLSAQEAAALVQVAPNPASAGAAFDIVLAQPLAAGQLQVVDMLGRPVPARITARRPALRAQRPGRRQLPAARALAPGRSRASHPSRLARGRCRAAAAPNYKARPAPISAAGWAL